jgi:23S rRNA (cytidine1920-2'-O)/16S rRNA (cytidine1409-2'-O)-methyltransferase
VKKIRLDQLVTENGLTPTRTKAQSMILAGLVMVNGETVSKAGTLVNPDVDITLKETLRYVSRGGIKLEGALKYFEISVEGLVVLDVGASTGGFTDCLLQKGAKHVFAIDVGRGQLDASLRNHPQVTFHESFHVRKLSPETFGRSFPLIVMDVSFISLKKVLPMVLPCLEPQGNMVILIKPQFETEAKHLVKGVIKDEKIRLQVLDDIQSFAKELGLQDIKLSNSVIKGPKGNQETFLYCHI